MISWHAGSASAERVRQREVNGVTCRVLCTWWLLGLAVEGPCLGLGWPTLALTALLSPCRRLISGRGGCLGAEWSLPTDNADYCMLVNK